MERRNANVTTVLAAAAGGALGAWAMTMLLRAVEPEALTPQHGRLPPSRLEGDYDGNDADVAVSKRTLRLVGVRPTPTRVKVTAWTYHLGFGAAMGALYGALRGGGTEFRPLAGLGFGAALWAVADQLGVPLSGFSRPPTELPAKRQGRSLALHLVFGSVVEGTRALAGGVR